MALQVLFWVFAALAVLGGLGVIASKNPVHGAMSLVGALFALAGLYLLLDAQLLAALQVLVYAGAVMVLFLFVLMLLNLSPGDLGPGRFGFGKLLGALSAAGITTAIVLTLAKLPTRDVRAPSDFGTVAAVGRVLYRDFTLPFEATSLLLLAAIIGAVVVAKGKI
ncbi:MAG: NADH-quinone oxidoreductase subunit J family protein [Deltaproteobacteria bacterium]